MNVKHPLTEAFLYTIIFTLIAHRIMIFGHYYLHDALFAINSLADNAHQISIGRFLQPVYRFIRGNSSIPWLIGVLATVFLSLSVYITSELVGLKRRLSLLLLSGIFAVNTTLAFSYSSYIPWVDIFMLSLLFSVLAVYFQRKGRFGFLVGAIFVFLSLTLYQSYITVTLALIMLLSIKELLCRANPLVVIKSCVKGIAMLILGALTYFLMAKLVCIITGTPESGDYNSLFSINDLFCTDISELVFDCYRKFKYELCNIIGGAENLLSLVFAIISLCSLLLVFLIAKKRTLPCSSIILTAVLLLLFPLGANCVYILSPSLFHELMAFGCFTFYLLPLILTEEYPKTPFRSIVSIALLTVIVVSVIFANRLYDQRKYAFEATATVMEDIVECIENQEAYEYGKTQIVFVGQINNPTPDSRFEGLSNSRLFNNSSYAVTYHGTYYAYLKYIMHYDYAYIDNSEAEYFRSLPEVEAMPKYPNDGCCLVIDNVIIVKLR